MRIKRYRHEIEFLMLAIAFLLIWLLGRNLRIDSAGLSAGLGKFPLILSGLIYIILYVVVTFFIFFSKDIFWIAGALLFGGPLSALFVSIAETVNAALLFHLARRFGRGFVEKMAEEKYKWLDEKLGRINFIWFFLFRAAPLIPYRFLDLAAGLTRLKFRKYLAAVILGSPVKIFWIQYILAAVGANILARPQALVDFFLTNQPLMLFSFLYLILVAAVVLKMKSA
jgi:uncharacterized membrane protein YdjX (TVP38/TMEM64 family)